MKHINNFYNFSINEEWSKNDAIPELRMNEKLGIILLGTPGVGKCLKYDTNILINNKLVKIGDIIESEISSNIIGNVTIPVEGYTVKSLDKNFNFIENPVLCFYRGYSDKLINIKTQLGIDISVTPDHPLLVSTVNGDIIWKKSKDILLTDKISKPLNIENGFDNNVCDLSIEMAKIIGYALSDGDFFRRKNSKFFNLTNKDNDIIDDFKKCIEIESNNYLTIKSNNYRHQVQFKNISFGLRRFSNIKYDFISKIEDICGSYIFSKKSHDVKIPNIIFNNSELLKHFIGCYLSCDGSTFDNRVEFYTTSENMSSDIVYSLAKFNINSKVYIKKVRSNNKEFYSYIIRISSENFNLFGDVFNDYIPCKRKLIKKILKTNSNIGGFMPSDDIINIIYDNRLVKKIKKELGYNFSKNIKYKRILTKSRFNKIISFLNENNVNCDSIKIYKNMINNLFFDSIISIDDIDHNDYVYDVVLGDNNNFIGGNIPTILHNSTFATKYILPRNSNIKTFSSDDVSLTLTKDPNVYKQNSSKLNIKRLKIYMESGKSFVYDVTGTKRENVIDVYNYSKDHGYTTIIIHLVAPLHVSIEQNKIRDRHVDLDYLINSYNTQFPNISMYYRELNPDGYYIVQNRNGKYIFSKYVDNKIIRNKNTYLRDFN